MAHRVITEVEENMARNLLARMRQEDPEALLRLLFDTVTARMDPLADVIACFRRIDDDGVPDLALVLFKGKGPAEWAIASMQDMKRKVEGDLGSPPAEEAPK